MGKKKDKLLAQQQSTNSPPVPWGVIDADPVGFLVAPEDSKAFLSGKWEQQPAVFKATPARIALFQGLCTFPAVINWLKQREQKTGPLEFGVDVNAARYKDHVRETPNGDVADSSCLQSLHNDQGCTLQLHQPQRFFDPCWRLLAALERQLGCLVGSNAYLTPKGSQGLAPHHDDVELWVVQTAGRKKWRLYEPTSGYKLPNQPSGDLDQDSLGSPVLEVELNVGDVLYMPRGTVHQAVAADEGDSDHLTISTYQRSSYADLATHMLQVGLRSQDEPECLPLAARRSPAPGTLLQHSLHRVLAPGTSGSSITPDAVAGLAEALRAIASKLESSPDMLTSAVHSQAIDFLINRLPPHPKQLSGSGPTPGLEDRVWCRVAGWCYLLPFEMTGMSCEDEVEEGFEDGSVKLVTCLTNSREEHMITLPDDEDEEDDEEAEDDEDSSDEETGSSEGGDEDGVADAAVVDDADAAAVADGDAADGDQSGEDAASDDDNKAEGQKHQGSRKSRKSETQPPKVKSDSDHAGEGGHHCCGEEGCGHGGSGVHEHSLSSGAADQENPVAALPGLVLDPAMVKAVVTFMAAETPQQAVAIKDLPLPSDAQKLQLAFALWAEGFAACIPAGSTQQQQQSKQTKKHSKQQSGKGNKKRPADVSCDVDVEGTATSTGKARPGKRQKA